MYDYRYEPHRLVFMIDNKSFFAKFLCKLRINQIGLESNEISASRNLSST